jgi:hypothetical protein
MRRWLIVAIYISERNILSIRKLGMKSVPPLASIIAERPTNQCS